MPQEKHPSFTQALCMAVPAGLQGLLGLDSIISVLFGLLMFVKWWDSRVCMGAVSALNVYWNSWLTPQSLAALPKVFLLQ